ncbi:unnamed protein product [Amoebophrya sp. A120]|nr:unnamed protein product [Amoebophrya sp. A120]|eukprot:GSA120T00003889001.1
MTLQEVEIVDEEQKSVAEDLEPRYHQHRPLVSVVIPVYNVPPPLLQECIVSVLVQTYPSLELILSDDCSTSTETRCFLRQLQAAGSDEAKISAVLGLRGRMEKNSTAEDEAQHAASSDMNAMEIENDNVNDSADHDTQTGRRAPVTRRELFAKKRALLARVSTSFPPIRVLFSPQNEGEAGARNRGIADISPDAEFICTMDGDDIMLRNRVALQVQEFIPVGNEDDDHTAGLFNCSSTHKEKEAKAIANEHPVHSRTTTNQPRRQGAPENVTEMRKVNLQNAIVGANFDRTPANSTHRYTEWANELDLCGLWLDQFREVTLIHPTWFMRRETFEVAGGYHTWQTSSLRGRPPSTREDQEIEDMDMSADDTMIFVDVVPLTTSSDTEQRTPEAERPAEKDKDERLFADAMVKEHVHEQHRSESSYEAASSSSCTPAASAAGRAARPPQPLLAADLRFFHSHIASQAERIRVARNFGSTAEVYDYMRELLELVVLWRNFYTDDTQIRTTSTAQGDSAGNARSYSCGNHQGLTERISAFLLKYDLLRSSCNVEDLPLPGAAGKNIREGPLPSGGPNYSHGASGFEDSRTNRFCRVLPTDDSALSCSSEQVDVEHIFSFFQNEIVAKDVLLSKPNLLTPARPPRVGSSSANHSSPSLLTYRHRAGATLCAQTSRKLLASIRVRSMERQILQYWKQFTIWGGGRDGKLFFSLLQTEYKQRVKAFAEVDPRRLKAKYYIHEEYSAAVGKIPYVDLRHFGLSDDKAPATGGERTRIEPGVEGKSEPRSTAADSKAARQRQKSGSACVNYFEAAQPPYVICVAKGRFYAEVMDIVALVEKKLGTPLVEGRDYWFFC